MRGVDVSFVISTLSFLFLGFAILAGQIETRYKIAVIDGGLPKALPKEYLCNYGSLDLTNTTINDKDGHATNIIGILYPKLNPNKHCIIILKWTDTDGPSPTMQVDSAVRMAKSLNSNMVIMALEGGSSSIFTYVNLQTMLDYGAKIIVAAGNDGIDLGVSCIIYPACYKLTGDFYVAESWEGNTRHYYSNYNNPNGVRANGFNRTGFGVTMTGTSQATAEYAKNLIP